MHTALTPHRGPSLFTAAWSMELRQRSQAAIHFHYRLCSCCFSSLSTKGWGNVGVRSYLHSYIRTVATYHAWELICAPSHHSLAGLHSHHLKCSRPERTSVWVCFLLFSLSRIEGKIFSVTTIITVWLCVLMRGDSFFSNQFSFQSGIVILSPNSRKSLCFCFIPESKG